MLCEYSKSYGYHCLIPDDYVLILSCCNICRRKTCGTVDRSSTVCYEHMRNKYLNEFKSIFFSFHCTTISLFQNHILISSTHWILKLFHLLSFFLNTQKTVSISTCYKQMKLCISNIDLARPYDVHNRWRGSICFHFSDWFDSQVRRCVSLR